MLGKLKQPSTRAEARLNHRVNNIMGVTFLDDCIFFVIKICGFFKTRKTSKLFLLENFGWPPDPLFHLPVMQLRE